MSDVAPEIAHSLFDEFSEHLFRVRMISEQIAARLEPEDQVVQSMPDISPTKWHLAHTTWFFETFALKPHLNGYEQFHPQFEYLFNSYYNAVGERHPRPERGVLSRPTVSQTLQYRQHVDAALKELLCSDLPDGLRSVLEIGIHHEQQHQELMLTDIKHVFSSNPLKPAYQPGSLPAASPSDPMQWSAFDGGIVDIGHNDEGFHYDNEGPCHAMLLQPFEIATRLVTNAEYLEFMEAGGYQCPEHWLSDGWSVVQSEKWDVPLYWAQRNGSWHEFTLHGEHPLDPHAPVTHVSLYEADAFARWAGYRLPTEFEWEVAAQQHELAGNFLNFDHLHPREARESQQFFGDAWEWTASPYVGYPGYQADSGALGEYNGKFMSSQMVLRGGSCVTQLDHMRVTYRNFFPPHARWQFSGIRLARWPTLHGF